MKIYNIQFPGFMERCSGFTIPKNGIFYALYFEESLARFDIDAGAAEHILDGDMELLADFSEFKLDGIRHPFVGYNGIHSVLSRNDIGELSLANSSVTLARLDGSSCDWQFENFSGDWEQVTFDVSRCAFLFGTPYDFDFKYVDLAEED